MGFRRGSLEAAYAARARQRPATNVPWTQPRLFRHVGDLSDLLEADLVNLGLSHGRHYYLIWKVAVVLKSGDCEDADARAWAGYAAFAVAGGTDFDAVNP